MIVSVPGKMKWITPEIVVCAECTICFDVQLRCLQLEKAGMYPVYQGISCPNCLKAVAVTQDWVLPAPTDIRTQMEWKPISEHRWNGTSLQ
jgi:hypothetical protein